MINKNLSAWVTDSQGNQLSEYQQRNTDDDAVECWIPSEEGDNFRIMWQPIRNFERGLGLRCFIRLDGRSVTSQSISPKNIARGIPGMKNGMTIALGVRRLFIFSRQETTDCDELGLPTGGLINQGVISVTLSWVRYTKARRRASYGVPKEPGLLHERSKKGHTITAALGAPILARHGTGSTSTKVDAGLPPVVFIFRYGPKDWLKAKDIIPPEPMLIVRRRNNSEPQHQHPNKRVKREPSPELAYDPAVVINIDDSDLGSDADSDVVILEDVKPESTKCLIKSEKEGKRPKTRSAVA